jgi:hypothetical protein
LTKGCTRTSVDLIFKSKGVSQVKLGLWFTSIKYGCIFWSIITSIPGRQTQGEL